MSSASDAAAAAASSAAASAAAAASALAAATALGAHTVSAAEFVHWSSGTFLHRVLTLPSVLGLLLPANGPLAILAADHAPRLGLPAEVIHNLSHGASPATAAAQFRSDGKSFLTAPWSTDEIGAVV